MQTEFPQEKPEDSPQDVAMTICVCDVPVLLYRAEKLPAVWENHDAPERG